MKQINIKNLQNKLRNKFSKQSVKMIGPETIFFSKDTKIGKNVIIEPYVVIGQKVRIGNNVTISSHSFICSMVVVEDDVFIGHGVMTINDSNPPSFRKTGTKDQWKPIIIKKGAIIGSNATIFPVVIGENARVGAGAVVTRDVPANATVIGNPAKIIN